MNSGAVGHSSKTIATAYDRSNSHPPTQQSIGNVTKTGGMNAPKLMNRTHIEKGFNVNPTNRERDMVNKSGISEVAAQGKALEGRRDSNGASSLPSCRNLK